MALAPITPRDKLERLADLGRKTLRYWWLVALFAVGGGALSLVFALTRTRQYQAESSIAYQERIQSSLLQNREEQVNRYIGDKYRELLMARPQMIQILEDKELNPFPDKDTDLALEKLRQQVKFESKGAATFRIKYTDTDPVRAKKVVERLTTILQNKDDEMRRDSATATVAFAIQQKESADEELHKRESALATFLAKHPEFATEQLTNDPGAAIRKASKAATGDAQMTALERQRDRLRLRLEQSPNSAPQRIVAPPSAEKIAAEAEAAEAARDLASAERDLDNAKAKYTDQHPTVRAAMDRVEGAKRTLRAKKAAIPPDVEQIIAPASESDRKKLQSELAQIEEQIAAKQKKAAAGEKSGSNYIVEIETEHAELRRSVQEQRETVAALAAGVSRAQIDASTKAADSGQNRLQVINPAEKPTRPTGPGKTIFLLAGMVLFLALGSSLAFGLAVIDDRLYRRADIDQLGIAVLGVIPPATGAAARPPKKKGRRAPMHTDILEKEKRE